jgi:phosphatidylserine/phosphatidylglycerophosphate/cardiolipin synthase-like enzyme
VLGCALILAVVVIWSIKRHRDPRLRIECDAPFAELLPSLSALTHGVALEGNAVEILENGAFFEVMFEEIGRATRSVHFETYLWKDGRLGRRLVDALTERSRAGVTCACAGSTHADRAARRAPQLRVAPVPGSADFGVPEDPAPSEGHEHRRGLVRHRIEQFR